MKSFRLILRDNIWAFIGVVVAILAIFVTLILYILQRDTKNLQVTILANTSLISKLPVSQDIQVLYKEQPVTNLTFIQVKLANTGNQAISPDDYIQPIKFIFSPQSEIVDASIEDSFPSNLNITIEKNQNIATLSSSLLNPGDKLILSFLIIDNPTDQDSPFDIEARIIDVTNITVINAIEETNKTFIWYLTQFVNLITIIAIVTASIGVVLISLMLLSTLLNEISNKLTKR